MAQQFNLGPQQQKWTNPDGTATRFFYDLIRQIAAAIGGGISGIVTAVTASAPLASSGGPTPNISHSTSGVSAATYGSATQVPQVTVNPTGHLTTVANVPIVIPVGSVSGLGTNVATFLGTPTSANLAAALTDETGTGLAVFATNPTLSGVTFTDATNIAVNTTTGTKIATATAQKLGFWNAAPIAQPTTAVSAATFVANTSGIVDDSATFDGYTIGQVVKALRTAGLLA